MIKRLFLTTVCFGLAVNLYADIRAMAQSQTSIRMAKWVDHSHQVTKAIDLARIGILEALLSHRVEDTLREKIRALSELVEMASLKTSASRLLHLTDTEILASNPNRGLAILSEMAAGEDAVLQMRMHADEEASRQSVNTALFCNGIDIFLIFLFLGFYFFERRTAESLQKALANTLSDVESSNQKLRLALTKRDTRLRTTVHDLKNPLGTIKGFAELLYDGSTDKDSVTKMASIIQKISNNTLTLVGAMLEEKVDSQQVTPEPVRILESLKETCQFLEPVANEKNQRIQIINENCDFTLLGSKPQIQDVFFNVVGNALKFSPKGSIVTIECGEIGGYHQISIKDQGPGFSKEDFPNLFVLGAKLSAKPTGHEGSSGIGLFSARQTILGLGGSIDVANAHDGGACISLRFPLA